MKVEKKHFMPGAYEDAVGLIDRIHKAHSLCEKKWSLDTFCHRVLRDPSVISRIRAGRVAPRQMKSMSDNINLYMKKRQGA